ncbi:MAG TPA: hypothetical protein VIQ31_34810 [Phormidium sp.]
MHPTKKYSSWFTGVEAAVYRFGRSGDGQWVQQSKVLPIINFPDEFGFSSIAPWDKRLTAGEISTQNE